MRRAIRKESGTKAPSARFNPPRGCFRSRCRVGTAGADAFALAALLTVLSTRFVQADDDATTAIARERFKEGVQYFDQGQYEKSRAAFLQAYALKSHFSVLLNLAQSELRSNHEAEAAKHFAQYLREAENATDAEREAAEAGLSAAKAVIAEVTVSVDEDGAAVFVDGTPEGQTPLPGPVYLAPGTHTLTTKKGGRETALQLHVAAGQSSSTSLRLNKAAARGRTADRMANREPEATESTETASYRSPPSGVSSEPGAESARQRKPFLQWVTHSGVGIAGGAVAVLSVGSGVGFALASKRHYDSADSIASQIRTAVLVDSETVPGFGPDPTGICRDEERQEMTSHPGNYRNACQKYRDTVDIGDTLRTVSVVSWVIAGVAVAGTLAAYVADRSEPTSGSDKPHGFSATVVPWLSGNERGVSVSGSF